MVGKRFPHSGLFLRGRLRHALNNDDKVLLESLIEGTVRVPDGHVILRRGQLADRSTLLLDGFVARVVRDAGNRHILGFQVAGDFVDLHAYALKRIDHDVVTIGPARIAIVPHVRLDEIVGAHAHLTRILWFSTLLDAAIHREWILRLEQLKADQRLAHIMAEIWHRLDFVELADAHGFSMPLLQADLADACGTTPVHMNRVIRSLRERGLLEISRGRVSIPDRAELERFAVFRADYLYGAGSLRINDELDA